MKAQRRHELKTNVLAQSIWNFPEFAKKHGTKLLLGVAVAVLVLVLILRALYAKREALAEQRNNLAFARQVIAELSQLSANAMSLSRSPQVAGQVAERRDTLSRQATDLLANIGPDDPQIKADSLVVHAELDWQLASFPTLAGAATQPALALQQEPSQLLSEAAGYYRQVVDEYPQEKRAVAAARFGLAAIEEDQHKWDSAKEQYEKILADADMNQVFKDLAEARLKLLPTLQQPIYIGQPATAPAAAEPSAEELGPVMPATVPSASPATQASN